MREGWLIDGDDRWIWRFWRDESAWVRDPKVFLDRGRQMPDGPPLLKERRYLRKDAAEQLWKSLQTQGWKRRDRLTSGVQLLMFEAVVSAHVLALLKSALEQE